MALKWGFKELPSIVYGLFKVCAPRHQLVPHVLSLEHDVCSQVAGVIGMGMLTGITALCRSRTSQLLVYPSRQE